MRLFFRRHGTMLAVGAMLALVATGAAEAAECADDPHVAGQCFTVHGRLRLYANLRLYLWPVGTKRLLGVEYPPGLPDAPSDPFMPDNLRTLIKPGVDVFGDFTLCPFTPDEPGKLRFVCVQSATRLIAKPE